MSWSNPDHSFNGTDQDDMDSSNGAVAKKLIVRNESATASGDYRTEVLQTSGDKKALRVDGKTWLQKTDDGKSVLVVAGSTIQNPDQITETLHVEYPWTDHLAAKIKGKTRLEPTAATEPALIVAGTPPTNPDDIHSSVHIENQHYGSSALAVFGSEPEDLSEVHATLHVEKAANGYQAVKVKGLTWLEQVDNEEPESAIALTVRGRTTLTRWDSEHRPQPILIADGRTELQAYGDEPGQQPELALQVTGRSFFKRRSDTLDLLAVKVDGNVHLRLGQTPGGVDQTCGVLRSVLSQEGDIPQAQLQINADPEDRYAPEISDQPHVKIGWSDGTSPSTGHGNVVAIRPRKLLLGLAGFELVNPDSYRIKAKGSTKIEPENPGDVALHVAGKTWTDELDAPAAGTLQIGGHNATLVTIADIGVETQVLGSLNVQQDADLQGDVQVQGTLTGQGVIAASTLQGSSLVVNGAAAISQALDVGGQTTLRNHLTVEHYQGQPPSDITATGSIRADMVLYGAELSVSNNATVGGDLIVSGEIQGGTLRVSGGAELAGGTRMEDVLDMNEHDLILGGHSENETKIRYAKDPDRIEFMVEGKVRFVIDKTGGHNV